MKGIDLFAGGGGTTAGATKAGIEMIWAANHNPVAVDIHARNHPTVQHACQDLHQADWSEVPRHDIMFASPCCQGHSRAAGKANQSMKADVSRSTAWAVVSCLEAHKTPFGIVENVKDFLDWSLFDAWSLALKTLGYSMSINTINAKHLGIPQNRERIFIVLARSRAPITLDMETSPIQSARTFIDLSDEGYKWDHIENRVEKTQMRVRNGQREFGEVFLDAAYGSETSGRSIDKPIGTITTINKHSVVKGDLIRPISLKEMAVAQSFDESYEWPALATQTKMLIGNAVPPVMAQRVTEALLRAA